MVPIWVTTQIKRFPTAQILGANCAAVGVLKAIGINHNSTMHLTSNRAENRLNFPRTSEFFHIITTSEMTLPNTKCRNFYRVLPRSTTVSEQTTTIDLSEPTTITLPISEATAMKLSIVSICSFSET